MAKLEKRASVAMATAEADTMRHKSAINQLERDNDVLAQELALDTKQDNMVNNSSATSEIKRLQDQGDAYTRKIELERRRIAELEKQISIVQGKVNSQRKKMGGVNVSKQNNIVLNKQIRVMENRLDKAIVRYNEILGKNKLLKDKIDDLRKERQIFDGIYKKLEREMHSEKKEMAKLVEECNKAYRERDEAKRQIAELKLAADEEQEAFQVEWKRLGELIEHDKRAKDQDQLPRSKGAAKVGEMTTEEESKLKQGIAKGAWSIGKEKIQIQRSQEKAQNYEEMFARIQEETGVTDIDQLVARFVEAEDKNFSLFTEVNHLNGEIEALEHQITGVESEIEKYRGQGVKSESQRKRILFELEQRLEETNSRADQYELKYANSQKILLQLKIGIQTLFERLGAAKGNEAISDLIGEEGVTDMNVMQYLGVIEQRSSEILQAFAASHSGNPEAFQAVLASATSSSEDGAAHGSGRRNRGDEIVVAAPGSPGSPGSPLLGGPGQPALTLPDISDIEKHDKLTQEALEDRAERPLSMEELQSSMVKQMAEVQRAKLEAELSARRAAEEAEAGQANEDEDEDDEEENGYQDEAWDA